MVYIARSRRPRARRVRLGGATATTTLRAGLNQMSEGLPRRSTPARGRRRTRGAPAEGVALLMSEYLAGVLLVNSRRVTSLTCCAPSHAPRVHPCARLRAAWPGHFLTD